MKKVAKFFGLIGLVTLVVICVGWVLSGTIILTDGIKDNFRYMPGAPVVFLYTLFCTIILLMVLAACGSWVCEKIRR